MEFTKKQKEKLSRILEDLGKLIFASHVLGFLITPKIANLPFIILGFITSIIFFILALIVDKNSKEET